MTASIVIAPAVASVNEQTECYANLSFLDQSGNPYTPTALSYRVDAPRKNTNIVPWTTLVGPFAITWVITITAAQNTKLDNDPSELRQVTVAITAPGGSQRKDYQVYSLAAIPVRT